MKTSFIITTSLTIITLAICALNYFQLKNSKIACIDTAKVLQAYKGVDQLGKELEEKNKALKMRLDTLVNEFQESLKEFEKKRTQMSPKEIQEAENKLHFKQQEYEQYSAANQESLKAEEMQLLEKAVTVINNKVQKYAKENGYATVLGATPSGGVIYISEAVDITDEIISLVND